jgi:hypothetical protein
MIKPGLYQMNFRGLSWAELIRLGGLSGFPFAVFFKIISRRVMDFHWFPNELRDSICAKEELSEKVLEFLNERSEQLQKEGFTEAFCVKNNRKTQFIESWNDGGGIYLFKGTIIAILIYIENRVGSPTVITKQGVIAFASIDKEFKMSISTSNKNKNLDHHPDEDCVQINSENVHDILIAHQKRIAKESHLIAFESAENIIPVLDKADAITTEWRISKGLYVYVGEEIP